MYAGREESRRAVPGVVGGLRARGYRFVTVLVTAGMLLANTFLLCWDWHRLQPILFPGAAPLAIPAASATARLERAGYVACTAGAMGALLWTRGMFPGALVLPSLLVGLLGGVMLLVSLGMALRRRHAAA